MLPVFTLAQSLQSKLDSLHITVNTAKDDTARMNAFNSLAGFYDDVNLDSSLHYSEKAIAIAKQLQLRFAEVIFYARRSWPLMKEGDYPGTLKMLNMAMDFVSNPANEKYINNIQIGAKPGKAFLKSQIYIYGALSALYTYVGNYEKAVLSSNEGIRLAESIKDSSQLGDAYSNLSDAYFSLNKMDSALYACQKAVDYFLAGSSRKYLANVYIQIGQIQMKKGAFDLAKENFEKAIQAGTLYRNQVQIGESYLKLAALYQSENKADSALDKSIKALTVLELSGKERSMAIAYRIISDCYLDLDKRDSSFFYLQMAVLLKDKLDKIEKEKIKEYQAAAFEETIRLQQLERDKIQTQSKIRTYGLLAGLAVLSVIGFILYRNNRQNKKAKLKIENAYSELKSTQAQLIQSEKMASLGELTAGIAHEIQNPLNFVNNFAELNNELIKELKNEVDAGNTNEVKGIANDIEANSEKINHHGKRAESIVKGMLEHSRKSSGIKEPTDINKLCDEFVRLSYHGLRAKDKEFNCDYKLDLDPHLPLVNVVWQDIGRVLLNIFNNAFQACSEKTGSLKLESQKDYKPLVSISTKYVASLRLCELIISDNGPGIPDSIKDKIFQPFFTTKPTGQGTGLGLSLAYDIVKAQGGDIKVISPCFEVTFHDSALDSGTQFIIQLPI